MNYNRSIGNLIYVLILALLFAGCSKEESEESARKAIILKLTGEISADSIESGVEWLQNMGTRFALADNHRNVAVSIKNRFIRLGFNNTTIDSFSIVKTYKGITYTQTQYNVIAILDAGTTSDSLCIIGGHYDNILGTGDPFVTTPGANDNASGVAAALEIARVMKKNNYTPASEIRFIAFGCEEPGLLGSKAYATGAFSSPQKIRFMLNNDMIAYEPGIDNTKWLVNILDYDNSHSLRKEAEDLCYKYTLLKPYNDNTYSNASDSYPFFVNGYKAIFFYSNVMDPNYHSLNDVVSHCNFEYCREIVKLNCAILVNKN